jgi:hypothetical protein
MSHRVSIAHRHMMGDDSSVMRLHKAFIINTFHRVSSGNPHQCSLKYNFGKARHFSNASNPM